MRFNFLPPDPASTSNGPRYDLPPFDATLQRTYLFGGLFPRPPPEGLPGFLLGAFGGTGFVMTISFNPGCRPDVGRCNSVSWLPKACYIRTRSVHGRVITDCFAAALAAVLSRFATR
jgi:hypothetical protein